MIKGLNKMLQTLKSHLMCISKVMINIMFYEDSSLEILEYKNKKVGRKNWLKHLKVKSVRCRYKRDVEGDLGLVVPSTSRLEILVDGEAV